MSRIPYIIMSVAAVSLSGCTLSSLDMQGHDPHEYYAEHPIKNKIEIRNQAVRVHFAPGKARLSPDEIDRLRGNLHAISMQAVESVQISHAKGEGNEARKTHLTKMLRNMGYNKGNYMYEPLHTLKSGEMQLDVTYAVVVSPDCPDWRRSPVTTYSNSGHANFGCAHETNLGLMVADPHDLVRGSSGGKVAIDTQRATKALQDYRSGLTPAAASAPAGTGGAAATSASGSSGGGAAQ